MNELLTFLKFCERTEIYLASFRDELDCDPTPLSDRDIVSTISAFYEYQLFNASPVAYVMENEGAFVEDGELIILTPGGEVNYGKLNEAAALLRKERAL